MTTGRRTGVSRFLVVHPSPTCAPGLAHKTKHEMTKHLALFASLGRLTLSWHIFRWNGKQYGWQPGRPDRAAELRHLQLQMQMQSAKRALRVRGAGPSA